MLLVLLLVAVLALSLAVAGCKSADTPQEQTPQEGGDVIDDPNEGDPANEGTIEYYDNLVGVQLTHDASLNSLSLPSLLDIDWGADVIEVTAPYHERDDYVATQVQQGLTDSESVKGYKRSLWLTLSYHDLTKLFEFVTVLKQRDDVEQAYAMPKVQYVAYDEDDEVIPPNWGLTTINWVSNDSSPLIGIIDTEIQSGDYLHSTISEFSYNFITNDYVDCMVDTVGHGTAVYGVYPRLKLVSLQAGELTE